MELFTNQWEFAKTPFGTGLEELSAYEGKFERVDLPHDWLIYDTLNLYETSTGWYRKKFTVKKDAEKVYSIRFDGVYMDSKVYINGTLLGEWKYGYSTFEFDMTNLLKDGENTVMVRIDHHEPNSRWYSGAGIFRNVWFKEVPVVHLTSDGVYIATKKCGYDFKLEIEAEISGLTKTDSDAEVSGMTKTDSDAEVSGMTKAGNGAEASGIAKADSDAEAALQGAGNGSGKASDLTAKVVLSQGKMIVKTFALTWNAEKQLLMGEAMIEKPALWDAEHPVLYHVSVALENGDKAEYNIGFRDFVFDPEQGFVANGKRVKLHGVCEHHDLGCLGAAFHKKAMARKIATLKKMGVNAIRTSHNMPAPELMDLADTMGMYIVSEAFDMSMEPKTEYDYARFFDKWAERDVASWIRRDRNHPSVIMWSIGNEIHDTHEAEGVGLTKRLMGDVLVHDPRKMQE